MNREIVEEIKSRTILHWNYRGYCQLPIELRYHGHHVREIYAKWNRLSFLPDWINELPNLSFLYLFHNQLEYIPDEIGDLDLIDLDLESNRLTSLPESIGRLRNLTLLSLQNNFLEKLPTEVQDLKSLKILSLKGNQFKTVPSCILRLPKLEELILDGNCLESLPREIVYLPSLKGISLNRNNILYLPAVKFLNCKLFSFTCNPCLNYIPHILGAEAQSGATLFMSEGFWTLPLNGCDLISYTQDVADTQVVYVPGKRLHFPLKVIASRTSPFIPSLYELCLRKSFKFLYQLHTTKELICEKTLRQLPKKLQKELDSGPVADCHLCGGPIFSETLLLLVPRFVLDDQVRVRILASVYFCSRNCYSLCEEIDSRKESIADRLTYIPPQEWSLQEIKEK